MPSSIHGCSGTCEAVHLRELLLSGSAETADPAGGINLFSACASSAQTRIENANRFRQIKHAGTFKYDSS